MIKFIELETTYNSLTTQGEGKKYINVEHIISITKWEYPNHRIKTIKSRITLSNNEILDVSETYENIINKIKK